MEQEHGELLNTAIKEVIQAIRWLHEHAEPKAAEFLTTVQGIYKGEAAFLAAYNTLLQDPDEPKATADLASAMSNANADGLDQLRILVTDFRKEKTGFKPLDPLKAYQRGEGIGLDALKSNLSVELKMRGPEEQADDRK